MMSCRKSGRVLVIRVHLIHCYSSQQGRLDLVWDRPVQKVHKIEALAGIGEHAARWAITNTEHRDRAIKDIPKGSSRRHGSHESCPHAAPMS